MPESWDPRAIRGEERVHPTYTRSPGLKEFGSPTDTTGELTMGGKTLDSGARFCYVSQSAYSDDDVVVHLDAEDVVLGGTLNVGLALRYTRGYRSATHSTFDARRRGGAWTG
jgi:hypothetical protein